MSFISGPTMVQWWVSTASTATARVLNPPHHLEFHGRQRL